MAEDQKVEKKSEDVKPLALVPDAPVKVVKPVEAPKAVDEVEDVPLEIPPGSVRFTFADSKTDNVHVGHGGISMFFDRAHAPFVRTAEDFRVLCASAPGKFVEVK